MELTLFPSLVFGLLAFAVIISIISSFRDDNNDRHNHRPDQGRYDDHDYYGQNRPIIIYTNQPDPYYGRHDRYRDGHQPFWSNAIVIIGLLAGLVYFLSKQDKSTDPSKQSTEVEKKKDIPQQKASSGLDKIDKTYPEGKHDNDDIISDRDVVQPHPENWYTIVSVFKSKTAAKAAMDTVAATIDLKGKTVYYGQTNLNRWMVYIPASTEREAKQLEQEVNKHQEELHPFCPEKPRVLQVG
jgi:hypothetical protein